MSIKRKERQREQRRINRREEKLDSKNCFGVPDPTPKAAVKEMNSK